MSAYQWALALIYGAGVILCCGYAIRRLHEEDVAEGRGHGMSAPAVRLYLLAFGVRVAFVAIAGKLVVPDTYEQEDMALAALSGHGFSYELLGTEYQAYGPPLYTLVSALVYGLAGHLPWALVVFDAAISSTTVPIVHAITRRLFHPRAALLAGILAALHPALLVYAGKLHELNVEIALAAGIVLCAIWWLERGGWPEAVTLAAFTAVGAMGRPTFLFVALPIAAWSLFRPAARRAVLTRVGLAAALVVVGLLPWTAYVSSLYGRPIFFNVTGGIVFWYGNNPAATGSGIDASGRPVFDSIPADLRAGVSHTDALSADAALRDAAWAYIRSDPLAFVVRTGTKLVYFWTVSPSAGALYPALWRSAYLIYYAGIVTLAAIGVVTRRRDRSSDAAIVAIVSLFAFVSILQSVFYVDGRHRWEVESVLLCLSGGGLAAVIRRYRPSLSAMSSR